MEKLVELVKYILLGILQGICEVLPISSSGHLIIVSTILGIKEDNLAFEVFLHLASLLAILFFLRKRIKQLIVGCFRYLFKKEKQYQYEFQYMLKLVIATIPLVLFTLVMKKLGYQTNRLLIVGICLIINAIMLFLTNKKTAKKGKQDISFRNALVIGAFQMFGLFPGISRSGSCLSGCFQQNIDKEKAKEFAFMLFIPSAFGAMVLEMDNLKMLFALPSADVACYCISFFLAMITTYISFQFLSKIIRDNKLSYFSLYCILMGILVIIYSAFHDWI